MNHASRLIERATLETGLTDFGEDSFREGLEILVEALDREARLNEIGRQSMDHQIVGILSQRLQVEDWYRRHPEIDEGEVTAPLITLGLPRTGSTALACLLGEDPAIRCVRTWESINPCPPPDLATRDTDPRIAIAEQSMERRARLFPRMTSMVPSTATSPSECQSFMAQDFKSQLLHAFVHVPSYVEWLNHRADLVPTYRYLKRVLKLLQWRCPPDRWRLKNPSHSLFIDALATVFPDARFVMTHRDVARVVPSIADLYWELRKAYSDDVDKLAIGREAANFAELAMQRMIAFRNGGNEERFIDVYFQAFQDDPMATVAEVYAFAGEELTLEARQRMDDWRRATPRDVAYQRTDMAEFGLDAAELHQRFRFYSDRFHVPDA